MFTLLEERNDSIHVFLTHIQKERKKGHLRLQCAKSEARRGIAARQKRISKS